MNITGNTVLITGGNGGIGLGLAKKFIEARNTVIICGRNQQKLDEAKKHFPELHTVHCDLSKTDERIALYKLILDKYPTCNMLINNAGIQQRINLQNMTEDWEYYNREIVTNVEAPIHLTSLFLQHLIKQNNAAIINISSGLAFAPMPAAPIYCATKAAIHSFTVSLRYQLANTNVRIVEVAPPAVATDLCSPGLHTFGVPVGEFTDSVFADLQAELLEIGYGTSKNAIRMSRDEIDQTVKQLNERVPY